MRIRDIRQTGFYARAAGGGAAEQPAAVDNHTRQFHALHVVGIAPAFLTELVQFVFIPMTATTDGNAGLIHPDILFGEDDGWRLLCDGTESSFGPHTFLMKLMELAGYSKDEARRIARETLIESLDRQIYGSA